MRKVLIVMAVLLVGWPVVAIAQDVTVEQKKVEINSLQVNVIGAIEDDCFDRSGIICTYDKSDVFYDLEMEVCTKEELDGSGKFGFVFMKIGKKQSVVIYQDELPGLIDFIKRFVVKVDDEQSCMGRKFFYVTKKGFTVTYSKQYYSMNNGKPSGWPGKEYVVYFSNMTYPIVVKCNKGQMETLMKNLHNAQKLLEREMAPKQMM